MFTKVDEKLLSVTIVRCSISEKQISTLAASLPTLSFFPLLHTHGDDRPPSPNPTANRWQMDLCLNSLSVIIFFLSVSPAIVSINKAEEGPLISQTSSPTFDLQQCGTLLHAAAQEADDPRDCCSHLVSSHLKCTYCEGYHTSVHTCTHRRALVVLLMVTLGEKQETKI